MKDRVSITVENGIADVKLIRTDKMNALDEQMFDAIIEAGGNSQQRCKYTLRRIIRRRKSILRWHRR